MDLIEIKEEVQIGDIILEKGDRIKVLKEGIQRGKEFDALEDAIERFGCEIIIDALAKAMGTEELKTNLEYIFRQYDYESPYLI